LSIFLYHNLYFIELTYEIVMIMMHLLTYIVSRFWQTVYKRRTTTLLWFCAYS